MELRTPDRFPEGLMFQLRADEFRNLKSQIVTSSGAPANPEGAYIFDIANCDVKLNSRKLTAHYV